MTKRQLKVLSASQFERFACPRRGVLEYVHGFKQPPTDSLLLGSRVHAVAEGYLKVGFFNRDSEAGEVFAPAIPLIPKPGQCETERAITFETPNSPWRGAIDYLRNDGTGVVIGDFKTTKSIKYRKTEAELKKNVQANLYAYWSFDGGPNPGVRGEWVYLSTGATRGAHVTHVDFDYNEVTEYIGRVDERAALIQAWQADAIPLSRIDEVDTDTTKCFEYGKTCHHRLEGRCIIKQQSFGTRETSMGESILDRIKRQKAENAAKFDALRPGAEEQADFSHPAEPPPGSMAFEPGVPEAGFINPPAEEKLGDFSVAISEGPASLAAEDKEHAGEVDERAQLKSECVRLGLCEPNSRLRIDALKKLLLDAKGLSSEERPATLREVMEAEETTNEPEPSMQRPERVIDTLYVDCLPNGVVTDAQMIVGYLLPDVLKQVGEAHVKHVAYGKGTATLALAVEHHIKAQPIYDSVFVDSRTIDADVMAVLVRNSATVVRGLR